MTFETDLDSLRLAIDSLGVAIERRDSADSRTWYRNGRARYKRVEGLVEFMAPGVSGALNGPLPEDDGDAPPRELGAPAAFQRVDAALREKRWKSAAADVGLMRNTVSSLQSQTRYLNMTLADVLDATRLEIARVSTLGLSGFDAATPGDALPEAADALDGARHQLQLAGIAHVDVTLGEASVFLRSGKFEELDRLHFITRYAIPAARAVGQARVVHTNLKRRAWRDDAASVFDSAAFDASAYAPEFAPHSSDAVIALGRRMFFDPRLSGDGKRSCASCHAPDRAFTDGLPRSLSSHTARNTPTLLNAALQPELFADERAKSLEDQVGVVLASADEMRSSAAMAATRLNEDSSYRTQFRTALTTGISALSVRSALAAYVRSLTSLASRFDRAVRGDTLAMSAEEQRGFTVFMGKGRCGTCHFAPLFNGTMPPDFVTSEPEIIGVPRAASNRSVIDVDVGRAGIDHIAQHQYAFKVPTLRNIARTAPYMHNGVFRTLDEVVAFYDRGGGATLRGTRPAMTLSSDSLHLTRAERASLVAFMRTLTNETSSSVANTLISSRLR